jgi:hypothetical protein
MRCDTCKEESPVVMRVVVAKDYNRSLARPMFNCPSCFEKKERRRTHDPTTRQVVG